MATSVIFVPGFMGSTLGFYEEGLAGGGGVNKITTLWGDLNAVPMLPWISYLFLPQPPTADGVIVADGIAPSTLGGYTNFLEYLREKLPADMTLLPWPYDWRLSARDLGRTLANVIKSEAGKGNVVQLVCHSYGALVAWSAWAYLVDDAATSALARFITFGAALYGTNSTPAIFREEEEALGLILQLQAALLGLGRAGVFGGLQGLPSNYASDQNEDQKKAMLFTVSSWPAVYDLFPDFSLLDDPFDENRPILFQGSTWVDALCLPNTALMAQEVTRLHQWLRVPKYLPPYDKVSHIVGVNQRTSERVVPADRARVISLEAQRGATAWYPRVQIRRLKLPSWSITTNGDKRCTESQQAFPGYYRQNVSSSHAAMQDDTAVRQLVIALLTQTPPARPVFNPVAVATAPEFPPAIPSAPPFLFNNDPVSTQRRPVLQNLPTPVGKDP